MKTRLHQFLSRTGVFHSKKQLLECIRQGQIKIGEKVVNSPHYQFDPGKEKVFYQGFVLEAIKEYIYIIINKPEGYLSSKLTPKDKDLGKKSVFELIDLDDKTKNSLSCVGRLDEDTSGLLILTNDGMLSKRITRPQNNIAKTYHAVLEKPLGMEDKQKIEPGVEIKLEHNHKITKYMTKPCKISNEKKNELDITITEGKKREVKRIFEAVGNEVIRLQRIAIGSLRLDKVDIEKGKYVVTEKSFIEKHIG
ncbi:rRNA pseudouridine synthase [Candidatus Woesearchaeota archaeon]|nr:rRNA pseudouridine synthase [Candidatus Woesearchaeota archaeon]